MRRNDRSRQVLATLLLLSGCSTAEHHPAEGEQLARSHVPTWEQYLASAERSDEGFVVEMDLWFPDEEALRLYYESLLDAPAGKAHTAVHLASDTRLIWPRSEVIDIRYCVSQADFDALAEEGLYERTIDEMAIATQDWEDVANINFKYIPSEDDDCSPDNDAIDIAVFPKTGGSCASYPLFFWPSNEPLPPNLYGGACAERALGIDYYALSGDFTTSVGVFRHELGHVLGFLHEHAWFWPEGGPDVAVCGDRRMPALDWFGEPLVDDDYDEASVMHYRTACGAALAADNDYLISKLDGESARELYGMPASWYVAASVL